MTVRLKLKQRGALSLEFAEGELELLREDGTPVDLKGKSRLLLCRCGASECKPFCDGSHNRIGFGAPPEPQPEGDDPHG